MTGALHDLNRKIARFQFGAKRRIRFYGHLMMMLENRIMLIDALREMHSVASDEGKRPDNGYAIIIDSCYDAVSQGNTLAEGLGPWISVNEAAVIAAGEQAGDMRSAFQDAIAMIEAGMKIRGAIVGASIYPVVLLVMLCVLLHIIASDLVPKLSAISNPENWSGSAYFLYIIGNFVNKYGLYAAAGTVTLILAIGFSLPMLGGKPRVFMDRLPPWSIYRTIHGSIFMLNVSLLIRSGMMLQSALELLLERSGSRWLRDRIEATLDNIALGAGFGDALHDAGYEFPDREAIGYLRLLSRLQGFDQSMAKFARHWLDETITKVQAASRGFLMASILLMGGMLTVVVTAVSDIEGAIETSVSQPSV